MAVRTGLGDNAYVGSANLSGDIASLDKITSEVAALPATGINKFGQERLPGKRNGQIDFTTYYNTAAGQEHPTLKTLPTTDTIVSYFQGTAIGNQAASINARQINYDAKRGADGSLVFVVSALSDGFGLEWGSQLTAGVRTDTTATNGTSLDLGASTAFDGQAYVHVFAVTGTSVTINIQDSPDNITFTNVLSSPLITTSVPGFARVGPLQFGTLNRYVRVITQGTFSNAQFAVNIIRNQVATVF